ncbi:effector-associated constant component EACC1 [Streptosporangium subroseum]|uniref:effector-associated constant component EACC1 n=1 Tax=Streptosporangium subroseum TaxID=106412 RepID=UPI00308D4BEF|nr:hypothetical protein OHB15_02260 [Streptosporangium subroseum]
MELLVNINIRITGEDSERELRSLYDWLREEPNIRQHAKILLVSKESSPHEMGDTLDLIALIITGGLQLPVLAETILGWRETRRRLPCVTIERGESGEMRVELSTTNIDDVLKIIDAMESRD